ncbi:MAG: hypothetical protein ABH834_02795 [Candidatus Altiarchaeota archaeon]
MRQVIEESLKHSNFIRLDFRANPGANVPVLEHPPVAPVSETHDVSMTYGLELNPNERVVEKEDVGVFKPEPVDQRITQRLVNGGNVMMGCAEQAASAVEIQMGHQGEVATRQVLVRLEQVNGKNYAVVEKLSTDHPTEIFREDAAGNISPVQAPGSIARVEIPENEEVTVKIGLGVAPHLQLPSNGVDAPSESAQAISRSVPSAELPDLAVEMSKYRFRLKFTPKDRVTHPQPGQA